MPNLQLPHEALVDDADPALREGADAELRLPRAAQLAHDEDVQRGVQPGRHLRGDHHAAPREPDDDGVSRPALADEIGQSAPGVAAVSEHRRRG